MPIDYILDEQISFVSMDFFVRELTNKEIKCRNFSIKQMFMVTPGQFGNFYRPYF